MKRTCIALLFLGTSIACATAQIGGRHVFEFLNLPASARVSALGGHLITVIDDDANLGFHNPASLNETAHQALSFNYQFYLADISTGYASYAHHDAKSGITFHGGVKFIDYGEFERRNVLGVEEGSFRASEFALTVGAGKQLYDRMRVGANLHMIGSYLEGYSSSGLAFDLAASYILEEKNMVISLVLKNAGFQLNPYENSRESLPFDLQMGFSQRLKYLPFRFSIIAQQMHRWDIRYDDPALQEDVFLFGEEPASESENKFLDNLFRHLVFNGEFLLGKTENLRLRIGYNHLRKKELSIDNYRTLAGFTFGFGVKISRFRIDYGFSKYHVGGGASQFSISTNLKEFSKNPIIE